MSRAVLVGTDLGAGAGEALRQAQRICREKNAQLIVCHAIPNAMSVNMLFPQLNSGADFSAQIDQVASAVRDHVMQVTQLSADDFEIITESGDPEEVLVRSADERGVDLLVVGSASEGVLGQLLGTVTERVVRLAHVPVLVARQTAETGVVLAATDFSDQSLPAVERAVAEARQRRARLHLVHCLSLPIPMTASLAATGAQITAAMMIEMRQATESKLRDALARFDASGDCHAIEGPPGPSIVQLADELKPELIVMGTAGHTGLLRIALGSVAEYVVHHAKQSTLVVHLAAPPK